jgi:molecular chaperone HscB
MASDLTQSHFELFGLPPAFDLDPGRLAAVYRELQRAVHPDRYAGGSDQERRLSVQRAAQVNEAYQVLKDPLRRARYLLELAGVGTREETNTAMDPAFLMEQMEWRERLEEVGDGRDLAGLMALGEALSSRRKAMTEELATAFRDGSPQALEGAAETVRELRFVEKLLEEVAALEERLG